MTAKIEFIPEIEETTLPIVKLTKSKNGKTGTATFIFIQPNIFNLLFSKISTIDGMFLLWENKKIITKDITIMFREGKPFLLKSIFIFKNSKEWFDFLNFMNLYSKETGLFFSESNTFL